MKHTILLLFLLPVFAHGQVFVNEVNINKTDAEVCQLTMAFAMGKYITSIDYGQIPDDMSKKEQKKLADQIVTGPDKKARTFQSGMAGVRFMTSNGWDFLQYARSEGSGFFTDTYFFKKKP